MSLYNAQDGFFMRRALAVAEEGIGRTDFAPSIGCVIVKNGRVIARGRTQDGGVPHAEETALRNLPHRSMAEGATVYVTLEPCAVQDPGAACSCSQLLVEAKVARVVMAVIDPDSKTDGRGLEKLRAAGIETTVGIMGQCARMQNEWFYRSRARRA